MARPLTIVELGKLFNEGKIDRGRFEKLGRQALFSTGQAPIERTTGPYVPPNNSGPISRRSTPLRRGGQSPLEVWLRSTAPEVWSKWETYRTTRKAELRDDMAAAAPTTKQESTPAQAPTTSNTRPTPQTRQSYGPDIISTAGPIGYGRAPVEDPQMQGDPQYRRAMFRQAEQRTAPEVLQAPVSETARPLTIAATSMNSGMRVPTPPRRPRLGSGF